MARLASGDRGELRVGWHKAADLGAWSLVQDGLGYQFRARVVDRHAVWSTQQPIDLVITLGETEWVWPDVRLTWTDEFIELPVATRPKVVARAGEPRT